MKRFGALLAASALCGALVVSGPASAFHGGWGGGGFHAGGWGGGWHGGGWGGGWRGGGWNRWSGGWGGWGWGGGLVGLGLGYGLAGGWDYPYYDYYDFPYGGYAPYPYSYAPGYAYVAPAAPLVTGRSVATGGIGDFCSTPVKTCQLIQPSYVGGGCSCRVPGGRARGSVTP
jgi:hypothetical protein